MFKPQWDLLLKKMMDTAVGVMILGIYDSLNTQTGNAAKLIIFGLVWLTTSWCLISLKKGGK